MIVGRAQIRNPDNLVAAITIEMTMAEWKRFRSQIRHEATGAQYEVNQVRSLIADLIAKAEKEFYINVNDVRSA